MLLEDAATEDYSSEGAQRLAEVDQVHFWFEGRKQIILETLKRTASFGHKPLFVEFGCGNGYVIAGLEQAGWNVIGVDMHIGGLRIAEDRSQGYLICSRLETVEFSQPVDAVGLFDVIEHIEDDYSVLKHAISQIRPGGLIVITVPALSWLWSKYDDIAAHKRRYSHKQLRLLLNELGLEVVYLSYAFSFAVIPIWLQRHIMKKKGHTAKARKQYSKPPNYILNNLFALLCKIERAIMRAGLALPIGSSLICVGRVPKK